MLDLARRGAEARYRELLAELKMLAQAFPHLRDSFDRDELPVNFILRVGRDKAARSAPTRRGNMSAKGRAAISAAQKARWKRQKAAEKNK
ncbi:MAG: hypothetical protein JF601_11115 [Acidobacteria bacterium]|jgi:hypothetical protein|nr:hypothetical protein [Acidobacteriota bacterium]